MQKNVAAIATFFTMPTVTPMPRVLKEYARSMRMNATCPEKLIWQILRDRNLNFKFRRQHPMGRYILDFYCSEKKLAIELDGSQHLDPESMAYDEQRNSFLRSRGIRTLRYENNDVLQKTQDVIEDIWNALHSNDSALCLSEPSPAVNGTWKCGE